MNNEIKFDPMTGKPLYQNENTGANNQVVNQIANQQATVQQESVNTQAPTPVAPFPNINHTIKRSKNKRTTTTTTTTTANANATNY